jgi:hypothetical protein
MAYAVPLVPFKERYFEEAFPAMLVVLENVQHAGCTPAVSFSKSFTYGIKIPLQSPSGCSSARAILTDSIITAQIANTGKRKFFIYV